MSPAQRCKRFITGLLLLSSIASIVPVVVFADQPATGGSIADFFKHAKEFEDALSDFEKASGAERAAAYKDMLRLFEDLVEQPAYQALKSSKTNLAALQRAADFTCLSAKDLNFTAADAEELYKDVIKARGEAAAYAKEAANEAARLEELAKLHQSALTENAAREAAARLQEIKVGAAELEARAREAQAVETNLQKLLTQCPEKPPVTCKLTSSECSLVEAAKAKEALSRAVEGLTAAEKDAAFAKLALDKALVSKNSSAIAKATIAQNATLARVKAAQDALAKAKAAQSACAKAAPTAGKVAEEYIAKTVAEREAFVTAERVIAKSTIGRLLKVGGVVLRIGGVALKVITPVLNVIFAYDIGKYEVAQIEQSTAIADLKGGMGGGIRVISNIIGRMDKLWPQVKAALQAEIWSCKSPLADGASSDEILRELYVWQEELYNQVSIYDTLRDALGKIVENLSLDDADRAYFNRSPFGDGLLLQELAAGGPNIVYRQGIAANGPAYDYLWHGKTDVLSTYIIEALKSEPNCTPLPDCPSKDAGGGGGAGGCFAGEDYACRAPAGFWGLYMKNPIFNQPGYEGRADIEEWIPAPHGCDRDGCLYTCRASVGSEQGGSAKIAQGSEFCGWSAVHPNTPPQPPAPAGAASTKGVVIGGGKGAPAVTAAKPTGLFGTVGAAIRNAGTAVGTAVVNVAKNTGTAVTNVVKTTGTVVTNVAKNVGGAIGIGRPAPAEEEPTETLEEVPPSEEVGGEAEEMGVEEETPEALEASEEAPPAEPFVLNIAFQNTDALRAAASEKNEVRYAPRQYDIPDRGLVTVRVRQNSNRACLRFDLSEFDVFAKLNKAASTVNGARTAIMPDADPNTLCIDANRLPRTVQMRLRFDF
ncbi:MAG: hypothetical protein HYW56_00145 [Candidatus Harrisonbacteria bacterium]|nr:hypothetical protein [Candidatus Harrisonbacteria bacterium]